MKNGVAKTKKTDNKESLESILTQKDAELKIINSVGEAMSKQLDVKTVTKIVGDKVREIFHTEVTEILLLNYDTDMIEIPYSYYKGYREFEAFKLGEGLTSKVMKSQKPLLLKSLEEQIKNGAVIQSEEDKTESYMGVPIVFDGKVLGVVSVQSYEKNIYNENNVQLLLTLSTSMGIALQNAKLFESTQKLLVETEQRTAELTIINTVGEAMSKQLDVLTVTKIVGDKVREIFNTQVTEILLLDYNTESISVPYSYYNGYHEVESFQLGEGLTSKVINSRKPLLIGTFEESLRLGVLFSSDDEKTESYLGVPILFSGKVLGVVSIQSYEKNAYDENHIRLLSTLSTNMGVTLQNAKLFEETTSLLSETEQRNAELGVINSVQEGLAKELDISGIYELVGEKIREIFNAQVIDIVSYDKETNMIHDSYSYEKGDKTLIGPRPLTGFRKHVVESLKPLVINKDNEKESIKYGNKVMFGEMPKSLVFVPMVVGGAVSSIISLQNLDIENAFSVSDVRLLTTLANSMSVALENARLFDETNRLLKETEQRNSELGVINSVQEGLVAKMDIQSIYDLVGEKIRGIFNAQVVSIGSYNHENGLCEFKYDIEKGERFYDEPRKYNAIDKHLIETKKVLLINENLVDKIVKLGEKKPKAAEGTAMAKSAVWVPMVVKDEVKGYVSLQDVDKENALSESDVRLLTTLTNSMSVALENARLFDQTKTLLAEMQQRNTELGVINSVQEGLVKQVELQAIYDLVGNQINEIFNTQVVGIASFNPKEKTEIFNYLIEKGERFYPESRKYDKVREYLIKNKKLIHINENYSEAAKKYGMKVVEGTEMPKSLLFVPLVVGSKVNGYITLQNIDRENAFSESDVRLLTTLVNSMSVALENARLFDETTKLLEETKQQAIELKIINSVGDGLAKQMDFQSIIDLVGEKIREVFNAQVVSISTYEKDIEKIHHRYAVELDKRYYFDEPQKIDSDRKEIIETKQPLIFGTAQEAIDHSGEEVVAGEMPESFMGVPIVRNEEVTGVITVQDIERQHLYSQKDVRLLMTLASNMGVALENARLFEETKRLLNETQQRNVELSILNAIQEGLVEEMEFEAIIKLVGDKFREALGFMDLGIRLYDKEKNILHFPYEYEHGERLFIDSMEPTPLSKYVLETGKTLYMKKATDEEIAKLGITGQTTIPGTDESKSLVFVPIIVGTEAKGLILVENYEKEDAFSESEIRLLTTVANSMSVALENARLFDETNRLLKVTEQRSAELSVINSVQEGLARELDLQGIYELVGERLCTLFPDSQTLVIRSFDIENGIEHWQYAIEKGVRLHVEPRPFNWANKLIIETKKPIDIREKYTETAQKYGGKGVTKGKPPKSAVFVPIIINDSVRGSISLQNVDKENAFDDSDVRLVSTLVNSMSVALENARLFNETLRLLDESKKRTDELSTVNSISQAIVGHLEIEKLINLVGDKVRDLFKANIVYLALLDTQSKMIQFPYTYGEILAPMKLGEGLTSHIILKKEPLLINREAKKKTEELGVERIGTPAASYLGVPIPVGDEIIGVLSVQSTENENVFNEDDMRLLSTIAAHVGIALNNANAYEELNRTLENLQSTQDQLIAQEKLASLGQLTAGIAHEIKNPLNFVNNFSELSVGLVDELKEEFDKLKDKFEAETLAELIDILDTLKQNSEKIKEHGKRADSIVHSMLQHSRGKTGEKQPTDINAMLDEDLNLVYHGMRAQDSTFNIKIEREYDKNIGDIKIIPQDMSRVFLNILSNGCYESHRKKMETNSDEPAKITVKTSATDQFVEVRVIDNGFGIPEKIRDNLFTPFFTTKPSGKGTGLGLSISYDIVVREHHGELLFETEEGKFTEFIIRLPKNAK